MSTLVYTSLKLKGGLADAVNFDIQNANEETLNELFRTMKRNVRIIINNNRKSQFFGGNSPVNYTPGKLAQSATYKVTSYAKKGELVTKGTFSMLSVYAWIHDRDGETIITPVSKQNLHFFDHAEGVWKKRESVSRPGSPYFDEAFKYSMAKLGL